LVMARTALAPARSVREHYRSARNSYCAGIFPIAGLLTQTNLQ
jgi:hypothetical protein